MDHPTRPGRIWRTAVAASVLACAHIPPCPTAAAERGRIAVLPLKLLDTSGEPVDQRADHDRRLKTMSDTLVVDLRGPETFDDASPVAARDIAEACPAETPQCLLDVARTHGARFAFFGVLHKSSTLIMQLFLTIVAVETGEIIVRREFNFRGDNDESWARAKDFLVGQIRRDLAARSKAPVAGVPPR